MTLPRIIGITGYARHGKDTIANVLSRELGYNRIALADQMKTAMATLNPLVVVRREDWARAPIPVWDETMRLANYVDEVGWDEAKKLPEVRRLLQVFGTEVGRQMLGENVWIEALVRNTKGFYPPSERRIVIPDIRFQNEADWIHRMNDAALWRVTRPDFDNGIGITHASERDIATLRPDVEFINQGTVSDFKDVVMRRIKFEQALVTAREQYRGALDALADR